MMTDYTKSLTAEQLIRFIAYDYVEFSQEKIAWQRDEYIKICREWLEEHKEPLIVKWNIECPHCKTEMQYEKDDIIKFSAIKDGVERGKVTVKCTDCGGLIILSTW